MNIFNHIMEAQIEATRRGIAANAVAINDRLYYSKLSYGYYDIPIVCGLKCIYTNELPEDTMFAVFEAPNPIITNDEKIAELQHKNEKLNKQLEKAYEIIGKLIDR